ncbi:TRAP transporter substrate-binding protein [Propionivibrio dicarboxylicus]|uniref:Tripartite ATP-independent transporter solute receptor, DctP family n=1 Tax=Propionivibrio dicarboxylicus TaxID=83767 RepID=A0A1G8LNJ4_9RHOO|nr:TRAP transporter substrate-binding protein [Propionivibrio dicarboxylicus]SDI57017.1 tripartite ATP-independent transporter solute receptor, DctP family [Propionivibrio dicarboxylicus]
MSFASKGMVGLAAAAVMACFASGALAQNATERNIRLGHGIAAEHPLGQASVKFAEIMDRLSGGKFKIKVFPATQLGSETQMIAAVRGGVQEITIVASAPVATIIKEYMLFDLPFLFQNEKEVDAVLDGKLGQRLLDLAESKNMIGLCYWENGFRQVTNSKRPVASMDDMSGLKLRVMQNPVYIDAFKALGTNAIPMPFTELYSAMESKAIDAQENPVPIIYASKFHEVQKYLSLTNHAYAPYVVLVSKGFWDKLDAKEKEQLKTGCYEGRTYQRNLNRKMTTELIDKLKSEGMTVSTIPPAEAAKMRDKLKPVIERYTQDIGPSVVEQAQKEIAAVRGR